MEEDGSISQSPYEDSHLTPNFLVRLAQDVRGLRERVEDILQEIREDGKFSEMTEELYDERKSYLTRNFTELSRMQKELADQIFSIVRYSTPIGYYFALSRDSTVLCVSKTEDSKSSFALPSTSGSESLTDDLGNEKEKIIELQKKVEELNRMLSDCNLKNTQMGEEFEASKKKCWCLQITELNSKLNQSMSKEDTWNAVIERLNMELSEKSQSVKDLNEKLEALILENVGVIAQLNSLRDDKCCQDRLIQELETRLNSLQVEHSDVISSFGIAQEVANDLKHKVSELESELDVRKEIITAKQYMLDIGRLRNDLEEKDELVDDLSKKLDALMLEKDKVSSHYTSEISLLKRTHEEKEDAWNADIGRLKMELQEKCESADSHIPPKFLVRLAQDVKGLRECVEDILKEMKEDGNFSDITAELYDEKKSYLTRNLTELSRMHKALADQMSTSHSYSTPIGLDSVLNRDSSGFCVSDTEDSKSSVSLSSDSDSETPIFPSKLLISPVKDDARKDKETKAPEALLQKNFNSDDLENEKAAVIELQKEVADLKHALSDCNLKNTKLGDELEETKSKVKVSDDLLKGMKQKWSIQDSKESQIEKDIQSIWPLLANAKKVIASHEEKILRCQAEISLYEGEIAEYKNQIAELNKKNTQYTSELTKLKNAFKKQEDKCRTNLEKLRKEVEEKNKSVADLTKKLDTVRAEKSSQDNRIEDLETRLHASSENAQKLTNDLTQRVSDLEKEVDRQKEVISAKEEQKKEVIRQISSSLEHYEST